MGNNEFAPVCVSGVGRDRKGGGRFVVKQMAEGFSCGYDAGHLRKPGKRSIVRGWATGSTRSNERFLMSVLSNKLLTGRVGYACTFTFKDCPAEVADFQRLRENFFKRLRRLKMDCCHWLVEWQARGVPHIHMSIFFAREDDCGPVILERAWLSAASEYGALTFAQSIKPIKDARGWNKYLCKHAVRGQYNYQRSRSNIPVQWSMSTGRMWGSLGTFPVIATVTHFFMARGFYRLRRLARRLQLARARDYSVKYRGAAIRRARRCLRSVVKISAVRGLTVWLGDTRYLTCAVGVWGVLE